MIILSKERNGVHKFKAVFPNGATVRFGRKGYSDYTIHKDYNRMKRYVTRHAGVGSKGLRSRRENWSRAGAKTAGFWSRWVLWSKPSLKAAIRHTEGILGKKIVYK